MSLSTGQRAFLLCIPVSFTLLLVASFDSDHRRWQAPKASVPAAENPSSNDDSHPSRELLQSKATDEDPHTIVIPREEPTEDELIERVFRSDETDGSSISSDEPLMKHEKMWFMLRRRGWMNEVEMKRALEILKRTDEMFTAAGRDYFLTYGLLLGHCRHAGFTPWDDDMDMATNKSNIEWLLSQEGKDAIAAQGLELKSLGSGYHKVPQSFLFASLPIHRAES